MRGGTPIIKTCCAETVIYASKHIEELEAQLTRARAIIEQWAPIVAGARVSETPTHFRCGPPAPGGTATACMKLSPEFRPEAVERELGKSGGTE